MTKDPFFSYYPREGSTWDASSYYYRHRNQFETTSAVRRRISQVMGGKPSYIKDKRLPFYSPFFVFIRDDDGCPIKDDGRAMKWNQAALSLIFGWNVEWQCSNCFYSLIKCSIWKISNVTNDNNQNLGQKQHLQIYFLFSSTVDFV